jgi:hypothetical protein
MMNTFTPFSIKFVSPKFLISQLLKMICRVSEIDQKQLQLKNHKAIIFIALTSLLPILGYSATYTATKNGNWNDATVWGGAVPTATDNVNIGNYTITLTANAACTNFTTGSGWTIALGTNNLSVSGSFTFNCTVGTISATTGYIILNGTSQTINLCTAGGANNSIPNLRLTNNTAVSMVTQGNLTITGNFDCQTGNSTFSNNDNAGWNSGTFKITGTCTAPNCTFIAGTNINGTSMDFSTSTSNPIQVGSVIDSQSNAIINFGSKNVVTTDPFSGTYTNNILHTGTVTVLVKQFKSNVTSGNWNVLGTWLQSTDGGATWAAATTTPTNTNGLVTIQSGHTVTVTASATASNLIVDGNVIINGANTLTPTTATVNGTVTVQGTAQVVNSTGTITFNGGSTYNHGVNGGAIPTATWDIASNCNITGYVNEAGGTTTPTPFQNSINQSFGNFIWNSTGQTYDYSFGGQFLNVRGNLIISSTGTGSITLGNAGTGDLNVGGNFAQTGGEFIISASGARAMTVVNNFSISGGTFDLSSSTTTANYTTLNVGANFSYTGGTITESGSTTASVINFNGTNIQTLTSGGTLSGAVNFAILSGATVDFGTSVISSGSTGGFTLNSGGSIITANTNATGALTKTGANGTIQVTGTRTYNSGANYTFNGLSAQITGDGLSQNNPGIVTIKNSTGVTFSAATSMNYLVINSGAIVSLGTFAHTASLLFLGPDTYSTGVYGGTGSTGAGAIINTTYFKPNTGYITITNTIVLPISTSTTYTVPCGVTSIMVEVWGGGGAGGKRTSAGNSGGGGGGAYSKSTLTVTPGTTYTVTIGGGSSSSAAGGDSWFGTSLVAASVLAKGGGSVTDNTSTGANGGSALLGIGTTKYSGGTGATGSGSGLTGYSGCGGSSAGIATNGTNGATNNAGSAPAGGGNGGNGASGSNGTGVNGQIPGGAGGGAYRTSSGTSVGGSGANGMAKITYTPVTPAITLGSNPSVCQGSTSAPISYISNAGCPDQYSIDFNAAANTAGFIDISLTALPASSITIAVPANVATGTYTGTLKVRNSSTSTPSGGYVISVTVTSDAWTGAISSAWDNSGNWCGGIPTSTTDVVIPSSAPNQPIITAAVSGNCNSININSGTNVTIYGSLIVTTTITNNAGVSGLIIKSGSSTPNGTLIFNNALSQPVNATVEMYSKAYIDANANINGTQRYFWQYFGIPVESITADPTLYGAYVRKSKESGDTTDVNYYWTELSNSSVLNAFEGFEICQPTATTYTFKGQLVNRSLNINPLPYTSAAFYPGENLLANPYTAAINVNKINFGSSVEAAVYLYNTGSYGQWLSATTLGDYAGQYQSIPQLPAGNNGLPQEVPSMSSMLIKASAGNTGISFNYTDVIKKNETMQRVKSSDGITNTDLISTRIDLTGKHYSDRMWIFTEPSCTRNFDNGWDGRKMLGSSLAPQIYAIEPDGDYQVNSVSDMNNTDLAFQAGDEVEYTIKFTHENIQRLYAGVYLVDLVENKTVDVSENGSTYTFATAQSDAPAKRFKILTRPYEKGAPDKETLVKIFTSPGRVFVQNLSTFKGECTLYDIAGRAIKNAPFEANAVTEVLSNLTPGAYVVNTITNGEKVSKRVIVQ